MGPSTVILVAAAVVTAGALFQEQKFCWPTVEALKFRTLKLAMFS